MTQYRKSFSLPNIFVFFLALLLIVSVTYWFMHPSTKIETTLPNNTIPTISSSPEKIAFGLGYSPQTAVSQVPDDVSRFKLIGIIAPSKNRDNGAALISVDDNPAVPFNLGRVVLDKWTLFKVLPSAVILKCSDCVNGKEINLSLDYLPAAPFTFQ